MGSFIVIYSLLLTIISETLFLSILTTNKNKERYIVFILTNALTNILAQIVNYCFVNLCLLDYYLSLSIIEFFVFIVEFIFYFLYFKDWKIATFSLIGNAFTLSLTFVVNAVIDSIVLLIILPIVLTIIFIVLTYFIKKIYDYSRIKIKQEHE